MPAKGQPTRLHAAAWALAAFLLAAAGCVPTRERTYADVRREFADVVCRLDPGAGAGSDPATCDPGRPVTLQDALSVALRNNPETRMAVMRIRQAEALFAAGARRVEFGTPHGLDPEEGIRLLGERVLPALGKTA